MTFQASLTFASTCSSSGEILSAPLRTDTSLQQQHDEHYFQHSHRHNCRYEWPLILDTSRQQQHHDHFITASSFATVSLRRSRCAHHNHQSHQH